MILTNTSTLDGIRVLEYKGLVFGETAVGAGFLKEFAALFRAFTGGHSGGFENKLVEVRQAAIGEMVERARALGANAILGVRVDYERFSELLVVSAAGTAVVVEQP